MHGNDAVAMKGRPFAHGYEIYLEKATITFDAGSPLTLLTEDGGKEFPPLAGNDPLVGFTAEIDAAAEEALAAPMPDPSTAVDGVFCAGEAEPLGDGQAPWSGFSGGEA